MIKLNHFFKNLEKKNTKFHIFHIKNFNLPFIFTQLRLSDYVNLITTAVLFVHILIPMPCPKRVRRVHNLRARAHEHI